MGSVRESGKEWGVMMNSVKVGLMGGLDISWKGNIIGGGHCIMRKWALPKCTQPTKSGDGGGGITNEWWQLLKGDLVSVSIQGIRREKVHKACFRLVKGSKKWRRGQEGRGLIWRGSRRFALLCKSKGSKKRRIGFKEFEHVVFINRVGNTKSKKLKERR